MSRSGLFAGFKNVWTAAVPAKKLRRDRPLAVTIAGERIVFFRDGQGTAHALLDVCPHRGVALSLGKVNDGCLTCPFHGWQFAGDGSVCHVPYNPDAKREGLAAVAFPVKEACGVLWLFTGTHATSELVLPPSLSRTDLHHAVDVVEWRTHWTRAMENMLDWPHLPFVHRRTIGRALAKNLSNQSRMDIDIEPTSFGATSRSLIDGVPQEGGLDYYQPNAMVLKIVDNSKSTLIQQVCMIPVDHERTRMLIISSRSFLRFAVFDRVFALTNNRVALEDKAVVESSFPSEVPDAKDELSVRTDKLPLLFRKYYRNTLRETLPVLVAEAPRERSTQVQ